MRQRSENERGSGGRNEILMSLVSSASLSRMTRGLHGNIFARP